MDSSQRSSLERHATPFSVRHDVLAATSGLDRVRNLATSMGKIAPIAGPSRTSRPSGVFCRRVVFSGKKRGEKVGKTKRGKGTKILVLTDANGLPVGIDTASASPHESTLIESLLDRRVLRRRIQRLIYDAAADSDPLRQRLKRRGIDLVCPHRKNRVTPATQDGRKLRRYRRRWKIERSISWLQNFRRLVTRYEHHAHLFDGFVQLACLIVVLGKF